MPAELLRPCRLGRFEKTNAKLESFNSLEAGRFGVAMEQFRSHTRVLTDMKKDLDAVFRRIRYVCVLH